MTPSAAVHSHPKQFPPVLTSRNVISLPGSSSANETWRTMASVPNSVKLAIANRFINRLPSMLDALSGGQTKQSVFCNGTRIRVNECKRVRSAHRRHDESCCCQQVRCSGMNLRQPTCNSRSPPESNHAHPGGSSQCPLRCALHAAYSKTSSHFGGGFGGVAKVRRNSIAVRY